MNIDRIILYSLCFLVIYRMFFITEKLSNDDITAKISELYKADVGAIRNLSKLTNNLTKDGKLVVPGGLEVQGGVTINDSLKVNNHIQFAKSGKLVVPDGLEVQGGVTINDSLKVNNNIQFAKNGNDYLGNLRKNSDHGTQCNFYGNDKKGGFTIFGNFKFNEIYYGGRTIYYSKDSVNNAYDKRVCDIYNNYMYLNNIKPMSGNINLNGNVEVQGDIKTDNKLTAYEAELTRQDGKVALTIQDNAAIKTSILRPYKQFEYNATQFKNHSNSRLEPGDVGLMKIKGNNGWTAGGFLTNMGDGRVGWDGILGEHHGHG